MIFKSISMIAFIFVMVCLSLFVCLSQPLLSWTSLPCCFCCFFSQFSSTHFIFYFYCVSVLLFFYFVTFVCAAERKQNKYNINKFVFVFILRIYIYIIFFCFHSLSWFLKTNPILFALPYSLFSFAVIFFLSSEIKIHLQPC